jgi:hypothetical protein
MAQVAFIWGGIVLWIPAAILSAGILVLFFSNLSYIRQLLRQNKLIHRLGLKETLRAPWIKHRQKRKARDVIARCIRVIGLFFIIIEGTFFVTIFIPEFIAEEFEGKFVMFLYPVSMLITFLCIAAISANHIVQRTKKRLELITQLSTYIKEDLSKVEQKEGAAVQISGEVYQKIAQIERAQISRGRVQSILADLEEPDVTTYVIQKSKAAKFAQGSLDNSTSLRVQEQIDALTTEPHPTDAIEESNTGNLKLRVPQTPIMIGYTVDDNSRRIRILSIENRSEETTSASENGGSKHA